MASAQVLPKELRLSAPPTIPQARSYLFKQGASLPTYEPGQNDVITIDLPRLQRSYLTKDSYLKFRMRLNWNNSFTPDGTKVPGVYTPSAPCFDLCGAFGLFDRIEIYDYLGSTLLESTSGHGQLIALLMDLQADSEELRCHYGTGAGTYGTRIVDDKQGGCTVGSTGTFDIETYNTKKLSGPLCGKPFYLVKGDNNKYGLNAGTDKLFEFTVPLFSFLGLLSQKFAPLHNGYTIRITLNTASRALGFASTDPANNNAHSTAPTTYKLENVFMCCQVLELGPVAESMLISSTQGQPFVIPSKAYRNYKGKVPLTSSTYRLDLNLNVASLTNILFMMRDSNYVDDIRWRSLSYRIRNYLSSWYFQYGSTILPQTSGIQCYGASGATIDEYRGGAEEAYNELMKSRHNLNASNFNSLITHENFWIDSVTAYGNLLLGDSSVSDTEKQQYMALSVDNQHEIGKFAGGLDLELVSGRTNELISGMNTNGMNTSINLTFDPANTSNVLGADVDAWAEYDAFVNISPGIATTVSF